MSREELAAVWPAVHARVLRGLVARGADREAAADAVQEAAVRALRADPDVESVDALARWVFTVSRRVLIDQYRRPLTIVPLTSEADRDTPVSTEAAVEARVELRGTLRALGRLDDADRDTVLAALQEGETADDRRAQVRDAVRRHRARLRLKAAAARVRGIPVAVSMRARRILDWARSLDPVMPLAVVIALTLPATVGSPAGAEPSGDRDAAPGARPALTAAAASSIPPGDGGHHGGNGAAGTGRAAAPSSGGERPQQPEHWRPLGGPVETPFYEPTPRREGSGGRRLATGGALGTAMHRAEDTLSCPVDVASGTVPGCEDQP